MHLTAIEKFDEETQDLGEEKLRMKGEGEREVGEENKKGERDEG
jgi:hypothetical protein